MYALRIIRNCFVQPETNRIVIYTYVPTYSVLLENIIGAVALFIFCSLLS